MELATNTTAHHVVTKPRAMSTWPLAKTPPAQEQTKAKVGTSLFS